MKGCRKVHRESGEYSVVRQAKVSLKNAARVAAAIRIFVSVVDRVQDRLAGKRQATQECDIDAPRIVTLDQNGRQVSGCFQVLRAQALHNRYILDLLQCDDVRAAAVVHLQDSGCHGAEFLCNYLVGPVDVEALIAPGFHFDLHTTGAVRIILLHFYWQIFPVNLFGIVDIVEQVFDIERHDGHWRFARTGGNENQCKGDQKISANCHRNDHLVLLQCGISVHAKTWQADAGKHEIGIACVFDALRNAGRDWYDIARNDIEPGFAVDLHPAMSAVDHIPLVDIQRM